MVIKQVTNVKAGHNGLIIVGSQLALVIPVA